MTAPRTRVEDRTPPAKAFGRWLLIVGLVAAAMAAWYAIDVILLLFGGVLVAVMLDTAADLLQRSVRIPRRFGIFLVLLIGIGAAGLLIWWTGASLVEQVGELRKSLVAGWEAIERWLASKPWGDPILKWLGTNEAANMGNQWVARITSGATSAVWWLTSGLVVLVAGIYLAVSPDSYVGGVLHLTPPKQRDAARELLARMHTALRGWLAGVSVEMTVIGVGYGVGLWLLDVPMALAVGLCAFVLCFVPYLGALIAGALAIAVGFSVDTETAMWVVGLTVVLQGLESYILAPLVYKRSVHLPPVVTLGAQLVLGSLLGTLGLIVATPLAAVTLVAVKVVYLKHTLQDPEGPPEARDTEPSSG